MNYKENVDSGELSADQKARISQRFRAAKALLDRKRLRHTAASFSVPFPPKAPPQSGSLRRVPFAEIPTNLSPLDSVDNMKLVDGDYNGSTCSDGLSTTKTDDSLSARTTSLPIGNGTVSNSFETPLGQQKRGNTRCSQGTYIDRTETINSRLGDTEKGVSMKDEFVLMSATTSVKQLGCSSLTKSFTPPGVLDDDFDESILIEIDALCNQKSVANPGGEGSMDNLKLESNSVDKIGWKPCGNMNPAVLEELDSEGSACSRDNLECVAKRLKFSDSTEHGSLMKEYTKYIQSPDNKQKKVVFLEESLKFEGMLDSGDGNECEAEDPGTSEATELQNMPEEYAKYIKSLNDRQEEAACCDISVPLMIVAGPGSGKTSTMVGRLLMLLNKGISPSHILAMTFTTAAASEMRERIGAVAGKTAAKELTISTFHSFSLQLCRSHAEKLGRTPEFLMYGHGQQRRAIIEAVRLLENGKNRKDHDTSVGGQLNETNSPGGFKDKSKKWMKFVTQAKAAGRTPDDCLKMGDEIGAAILRNYDDVLKSCNALDYHDLITCSVKLLHDFPEVFKDCQESWKAVLIDEFQDTSAMQYCLLRKLASHKCITIVGDEDQSIFSFNGADISGFDSFRKDFPMHKEIRLNKNYRSTRYIVEGASSLIQNNLKRCQSKSVLTDNSSGSKITIKECCNEDAQCAFVVDKILEFTSDGSFSKCSFGDIAILYRRQVSGKNFQTAFRNRKIPFNVHGVAVYRKKVVRAIIALLKTTLLGCEDASFRRVFKTLLPFEKEKKKKVIEHVDKISTVRKCSFISAARDIFSAKISGALKRSQVTQGRKVLLTLDMVLKLVQREQSVSAVITSVANLIPQKYLLEQRAVVDVDGGKLLNEDNDIRSVLQYLLDDVSDFLTTQNFEVESDMKIGERGCADVLKAFIDYISERERENFHSRRHDNKNSVTLTTIHQSKGLEWDTVFIVKANESEIPLLHEFNGVAKENGAPIEEERRLLYVAMTRARKKLFILYVIMDSSWQLLQPSRFLREIPGHLQEVQKEQSLRSLKTDHQQLPTEISTHTSGLPSENESPKVDKLNDDSANALFDEEPKKPIQAIGTCNGNYFLTRFKMEGRAVVSHLFHQWAKKPAFQDPRRLLNKVSFVIDERLRVGKSTHKDLLRELKSCLKSDEAFHYAEYVLKWEQIPADTRAYIMREKQEHFQKLRMENTMSSSAATAKQIAYLQSLGCSAVPTSRLHASRLIEQYKTL